MGKILVFVSIIITAATAMLGFINKGHLQETSQKLDTAKESLAKTNTQLAKAEEKFKTASQSSQSWAAEKEQLTSQVTALKGDLEKTKTELTALNTKATEKTTEVETKVAEIATLKKNLDEINAKGPANDTQVKDLKTELAEQQLNLEKLQEKLTKAQTQVTALAQKESARKDVQRKNNFTGRVLAVNQAWNFVVLNLGDRNGMSNNVELLVKRGTQLVGKVRITSVEPATSIADIVSSNTSGGMTLQPNDQVISINEEVKD